MNDATVEAPPAKRREGKREQHRSTRTEVNGWLCLDKSVGLTSTQAVTQLKYLFNAKKAGHAGTLDPLASGVLPIAFGEATKTVPIVQDGVKVYRFGVKWGEETDTDDAEGRVVATSERRPAAEDILAQLSRFIGVISQVPPVYSAIKIAGERAYDLAREGATVVMAPREIVIHRLELVSSEPDLAILEAECGKGTYVRAIARDLGRHLGCYGHVVLLRRTRVGPFRAEDAVTLEGVRETPDSERTMLPVEAGLLELTKIALDRDGAAILRRGQKLLLRGSHAPADGLAYASCFGAPIAFGTVEAGYFVSTRVLNLSR
jgi:tRNA pseudouridine55 synthase